MEKAQVYAKRKHTRISPKKVVPVLNLVRGKSASEAKRILKFDTSKAAKHTLKTLNSAIANAKDTHNLNEKDLVVKDIRANQGPTMKRGRIAGKSKFKPILKRSCHIVVGLSEKEKK